MVKTLLTKLRDSLWVWNCFGPVYNRQIAVALRELYDDLAGEGIFAGAGRVLDLGSGPGYLTLLLAAKYRKVMFTGVDYSSTQIRAAEKNGRKRGIANCTFQLGNAMNIPFADHTFDAVCSVGSIKHWPNPERGLTEIRRVLAPGGWTIISETDREASPDDIRKFAARFYRIFVPQPVLVWGLTQIIFGRSLSRADVARLAHRAGFRNIRTEGHPLIPYFIVKAQK